MLIHMSPKHVFSNNFYCKRRAGQLNKCQICASFFLFDKEYSYVIDIFAEGRKTEITISKFLTGSD